MKTIPSLKEMKKYFFSMAIIFSLFVSMNRVMAADVTVTTTLSTSQPGWTSSTAIQICSYPITLTTVVQNNTGAPVGSFVVTHTLPAGCSINATGNLCNALVQSSSPGIYTYTFSNLPITPCMVVVQLFVPCTISSSNGSIPLSISMTAPENSQTINFQVSIPRMIITNFHLNGSSNSYGPNAPLPASVSPDNYRTFDLFVSNGLVEKLTFSYTAESEIQFSHFILQGIDANGNVVGTFPSQITSTSFVIDNENIMPGCFGASHKIAAGEAIRVTEYFDVLHCTSSSTDASQYEIEWTCPAQQGGNPDCGSAQEHRDISVTTTPDEYFGLRWPPPNPEITPALDVCGNSVSDIKLIYWNNDYDHVNNVPGSAMKTLQRIEIPFKMDVLTSPSDITLNGLSVITPGIFPAGFYTYSGASPSPPLAPYRVYIDFTVLTEANLASTSLTPSQLESVLGLVDGFIPDAAHTYNEIKANTVLNLVYHDMSFLCHGNNNHPFYNGKSFDDCPPFGSFFFSTPLNGFGFVKYKNMCQSQMPGNDCNAPTPQATCSTENNNLIQGMGMGMTALAESNRTDVTPNHPDAVIDYYYKPTAGSSSSPFYFGASLWGIHYFTTCPGGPPDASDNVTYRAKLSVPVMYDIVANTGLSCVCDSAHPIAYYPDPNNLSVCYPLAAIESVSESTPTHRIYIISGSEIKKKGMFRVKVHLNANCPPNEGDFDYHSIKIQAICNNCTSCALTVKCFGTQLFHHCFGPCGTPQSISDFTFDRATFGWEDAEDYEAHPTNSITINANTPGISLNRAYPCDFIDVSAPGSIGQSDAVSMFFLMNTFPSNDPLGTGGFQFFEWVSGTFHYTLPGDSTDYTAPVTPDFPAVTCTNCSLKVVIANSSFNPALLQTLQQNGATFKIVCRLKVKPMTAIEPQYGYYPIPQIRADYIITRYNTPGLEEGSCDPYGDNMTVLNIQSQHEFNVYNSGYSPYLGYFLSGCHRTFQFDIKVIGGFLNLDDFPNEFRPVLKLPTPITLTLPSSPYLTLSPNTLVFSVESGHPDWPGINPPWYPYYYINTTVSQQTVNLNSLQTSTNSQQSWPIMEMDGYASIYGAACWMRISGRLDSDCPAQPGYNELSFSQAFPQYPPDLPPFSTVYESFEGEPMGLSFPYTDKPYTQQSCSTIVSQDEVPVYRTGYKVEILPPPSPYSILTTHTELRNINLRLGTWNPYGVGGGSFNNVDYGWIHVTSPCFTVTEVDVKHPITGIWQTNVPNDNGYYRIGGIYTGNSELIIHGTVSNCQPSANPPYFNVEIEYGFSCTPYPVNPNEACYSDSYILQVKPEKSALAMEEEHQPDILEGSACNNYTFTVKLTSTDLANVQNPALTISLPAGLSFVNATWEYNNSSGNLLPATNVSGNDYSWNLNDYVSAWNNNGLPGDYSFIELTYTVTADCGLEVLNPAITVHAATGKDICANVLAGDDAPIAPPDIQFAFTNFCCCTSPTLSVEAVLSEDKSDNIEVKILTPGTEPYHYLWTNSNNPSTETTEIWVCPPPGIYTVTVTDYLGCSASASIEIHIPEVNFTITPRPPCGFDFTAVTSNLCQDPKFIWDFGDGNILEGAPTIFYSYGQNGSYEVSLTLECCNGIYLTINPQTVNVSNCTNPCVAVAKFTPKTDCNHVTFVNESDEGGGIPEYSWNFTDLVTEVTNNSSLESPSQTYISVNTIQVCLTVTIRDAMGNALCSDQHCENYSPYLSPDCREHCTYTQGFYGNSNGQTCDGSTTSLNLLSALLGTPLVNGYNTRTVTIEPTEVICLQDRLPSGTTPAILYSGNYNCATIPASDLTLQHRFKNVLLGQAITLGLNLRLSPSLNLLHLTNPYMTTYAATSCINGTALPGSAQVFTIPRTVLDFLGSNNTVANLLELANYALGESMALFPSAPALPPSLGDITRAVDAINKGFDKCRILAGFSNNSTPLPPPPPPRLGFDLTLTEDEFIIIPNPNSGTFNLLVSSEKESAASVEILNPFGQLVDKSTIQIIEGENNFPYDISNYSKGIYFVRISNPEMNTVLKLVLQ